MKKTLLALSLLVPAVASAEAPSYSFVEVSYLSAEESGDSIDGYDLVGSYQFTDNFYSDVRYSTLDDSGDSLDRLHLGLGGILQASDSTNFYGAIRYVDWDFGFASENGWGAAVGVRSNVASNFELNAEVAHETIDDFDAMTYSAGALWNITENFGVSARIGKFDGDFGFEFNEYRLGARLSF